MRSVPEACVSCKQSGVSKLIEDFSGKDTNKSI